MFPAPTTMAISTPDACTSTISSATVSIVPRSSPYSRAPISDSPESFSRIRLKTGPPASAAASSVCGCAVMRGLRQLRRGPPQARTAVPPAIPGRVASSSGQGEPLELEHLGPLFAQRLAHGLARVVDPRLVDEDP